MVSYWLARHVCNADRYSNMHFQSTVNMYRSCIMQRLHAYYACMILWKVFPCGHPPEHTVSLLVPVIPKHSKILIRLMEEITTWDENKPGNKKGTNYLSSGAGIFFSWTASFFNCGRRWGIHFDQLLDLVRGPSVWIRVFPKRCKNVLFFSFKGGTFHVNKLRW